MPETEQHNQHQWIPLFKSWRSWYLLVLTSHLILMALFYLMMYYFK